MNTYHRLRMDQLKIGAMPKTWLWQGFIAPRQITLLVSVWKSGKTTLMSHLLKQRKDGGALAGLPVARGVTAVVSEETQARWDERNDRLGFNPSDALFCKPFMGVPSLAQWQDFLDHIATLAKSDGVDLVIIDSLANFLPLKSENLPRLIIDALTPLNRLIEAGMAVVLVHHPRKASAQQGMIARGSGALPAFVDVLMEIYPARPDDATDRRRRISSRSRDPETPSSLLIELNAEGTEYVTLDASIDEQFLAAREALRRALLNAPHELTQKEIPTYWPDDAQPPTRSTLWRWLDQAVKSGLVLQTGKGTPKDPSRYCLPEKLADWKDDPLYKMMHNVRSVEDLLPPMGYKPIRGGG